MVKKACQEDGFVRNSLHEIESWPIRVVDCIKKSRRKSFTNGKKLKKSRAKT
jgi:hypothetical protein